MGAFPALAINPAMPRDPLEEYSRAAGLQAQLQQGQLQQQQIQANQQAQADRAAMTKAMLSWDGKSYDELAKATLQNGGSAQAAQGIAEHGLKLRDTASQIAERDASTGSKHIETLIKQHDVVLGGMQSLETLPDDQLGPGIVELAHDYAGKGLLEKDLAQKAMDISQLPPDQARQALKLFEKNLIGQKEQYDQAQEERKTAASEKTAQAHADQAAKAPAGEQEFQAYYKNMLGAKGLQPTAANEFAARQAYATMHRAPRNDQASADAIEAAAQSLATMNPKDLTRLKDVASLRGDQRLLIYNRAKQINPNFSTAEVDRKAKMLDSFTNGKDGQQLQSFGTFLEHAGEASRVVNDFRTTSIPLVNTPLNKIRDKFGDSSYTRMVAAIEPVRKEFEGFLLGGRALYASDREAAETILSENSSPAQIQAALKQMGHTVKARQNEIGSRFKNTMGATMEEVLGPMSEDALEGARQIGVDMRGGKSQSSSAAPEARPTTPAGATHIVRGSDGKNHYTNAEGTIDLGIAP